MKYNVFYCTPVESHIDEYRKDGKFEYATFDTEQEAIDYVNEQTKCDQEVDSRDNTLDHNNNFWYEVYLGLPVNEEGEVFDPVHTSKTYYQR